tara:strand:+ start:931 stop:1353 length:423 start_codon:yes stop_codon:yes gene_type:complete
LVSTVHGHIKHVFVLSNALKEIPEALNGKVTILKGAEAKILKAVHELGYYKLYIDGGRVVQDFLKADLIDELRITTMPILLGGGFPLFSELPTSSEIAHIKTEVFLGQAVQSHYAKNSDLRYDQKQKMKDRIYNTSDVLI